MNKEEWIWVAIRIFGIYLIVLSIIALPVVISAIYSASVFSSMPLTDATSGAISAEVVNKLYEAQVANSVKAIFQFILFLGFGLYFLKGAKLLHKFIVRETEST